MLAALSQPPGRAQVAMRYASSEDLPAHERWTCCSSDLLARAGGDWGSIICGTLGREFPERCRAIHLNMVFAGPCWTNPLHLLQMANLLPGLRRFPVFLSHDEMKSVDDGRYFQENETGAPCHQNLVPVGCSARLLPMLHQIKPQCLPAAVRFFGQQWLALSGDWWARLALLPRQLTLARSHGSPV